MLELRIKIPKSHKYEDYLGKIHNTLVGEEIYKNDDVILSSIRKDKEEIVILIGHIDVAPTNGVIKLNVDSTRFKTRK